MKSRNETALAVDAADHARFVADRKLLRPFWVSWLFRSRQSREWVRSAAPVRHIEMTVFESFSGRRRTYYIISG